MMCGMLYVRCKWAIAHLRVERESILMSERVLWGRSGNGRVGRGGDGLGLELVGEDEIGIMEEVLVDRDDIRVDIEFALIAHYWVQD